MSDHGRRAGTTAAVGNAGRWQAYVASAIGPDHVRAGNPNQDAVAAERFELPDSGSLLVFAVADGHGHARHFRSDRGSRLAVAAGVSAARQWASAVPDGSAVTHAAARQLVSDVVGRWRAAVAADLAADPISDAQAAAALQPDDPAEIPYGSTLLLAVVRADVAVLAQIGDGEILLVRPDGRHLAPIPGDDRLDGTRTTSMCQADALSAFRVALVSLAKTPLFAIFAATDGYGNAQADENWQPGFAADLVGLGIEHGTGWLGRQLTTWATLCASSDGSGDDTTAALALNEAVALSPAARPERPPLAGDADDRTLLSATVRTSEQTRPRPHPPAEAAEPPGDTVAAPRPGQRRRTQRWLVGAVLAAIALAAFLVLQSQGSAARPTFPPAPRPTVSRSRPATPSPSVSQPALPRPTVSQPALPRPSVSQPALPRPTRKHTARPKTAGPASADVGRPGRAERTRRAAGTQSIELPRNGHRND